MTKSLLLTIGLFAGFGLAIKAQDVRLTKADLNKALCRHWKPDYALMDGVRMNQMLNTFAFEYEFNADNTYYLITKDKAKKKGQWTFNPKKKYIELTMDSKVTSRITTLSETEFTSVLADEGGQESKGLPELEIHFTSL